MPSMLVRLRQLDIAIGQENNPINYAYASCNAISLLPALQKLSVPKLRGDCSALAACTSLATIVCLILDLTGAGSYSQPVTSVTHLSFSALRGGMNTALRIFLSLAQLHCRAHHLAAADTATIRSDHMLLKFLVPCSKQLEIALNVLMRLSSYF